MENLYNDIATRTNGDIYVGVVGPVRVGKSTFITKFMQSFVLPNMKDNNAKVLTVDELPQSADGAQIMTTQPKFVPNNAVKVCVGDISANVRLIDCVGYLVVGAMGDKIDNKERMVNTPWSEKPMPFSKAAEFGTYKVVAEHSTVAVLMTTDGSFGELPRQNFLDAEKRLVCELKEHNKPFTIVLNTKNPQDQSALELAKNMQNEYNTPVVVMNALEMTEQDVNKVFEGILEDFSVTSVEIDMPKWLTALPFENPIIQEIATELSNITTDANKIVSFTKGSELFSESERFEPLKTPNVDMGTGKVLYTLVPKQDLFYKVLSSQCGIEINSDFDLVSNMKELSKAKHEYDKLKFALEDVKTTGYGVVAPTVDDLEFFEPELVKQSGKWGVRMRASAPSIHLMRVDLETEISPIVGTEQQSQELIDYIKTQQQNNPEDVWEINMFGRSVKSMMTGGIESKINAMPIEAQKKMRKTLTRIVNEGKGGIICILL